MMRKIIRAMGLAIAHKIGARIVDYRTGELLGRAFVIPWRGRVHFIGLQRAVIPSFCPQKRLTYWKQELGFTTHLPPDFPGGGDTKAEISSPANKTKS